MAVPSGPPVLTKCSQVFRDVRYSSTGCCWGFSRALLRSAVGVGLLMPTPLGSEVKTQLEKEMDSDCDAGGHGQSLFRTDRACAGLIHKDEWELHKEQRRSSHTRDIHYITLRRHYLTTTYAELRKDAFHHPNLHCLLPSLLPLGSPSSKLQQSERLPCPRWSQLRSVLPAATLRSSRPDSRELSVLACSMYKQSTCTLFPLCKEGHRSRPH